jgi:elongator complex protein 3
MKINDFAGSLALLKRQFAKKYGVTCPKNSILLEAYHKLVKTGKLKENPLLEKLLRTRPIRSLSGIVNISLLTKAYPCPAACVFCPQEKGIPKSYLSGEPAVERAKRLNFDPYLQLQERLRALEAQGHPIGKIDLRIIGATWSAYPKNYQTWFIKRCFEGANSYKNTKYQAPSTKLETLKTIQRENEVAKSRIVGLSIETRPDWINQKEIKRLRMLGVTKVELGVQSLEENVLKLVRRGHGVEETVRATRLLKEAGFKVSYQMMLNLPGASQKREIAMAEELFKDPRFQPDYLKIYPCAIVKEAPLYIWYLRGNYKPYKIKALVQIIKTIKSRVPPYVRIERIIRDIPAPRIVEGPTKVSNLRETIKKEMGEENLKCLCIRCREPKENSLASKNLLLFRQDYQASGGREIFLSFEDKKRERLYSFLRLRLPKTEEVGPPTVFPILRGAAIIREVHTYGQAIGFGQRQKNSPQHQGLGKKLIRETEKIALKEFGIKKMVVISSVGVRGYFRKLGYKLRNTYMVKRLSG